MYKRFTFTTLTLLAVMSSVRGQVIMDAPKIFIEANEDGLIDWMNCNTQSVPIYMLQETNHNPSVQLEDTALVFTYDNLRSDGCATIFTVYETNEDGIVGLWQIDSSDNSRPLWLNSQQVSYDNLSLMYRGDTEKGVVVHSMCYQYPVIDSGYDGHDTLIIGREGNTYGNKNFCAFIYFPGRISREYQRQLESALAIRYGALLHGPYIDSKTDTLWDTFGNDWEYSFGVCGVGRDEAYPPTPLYQPKSTIREDILSIEANSPLLERDYVMLGHNKFPLGFGDESIFIDTVFYSSFARHWKLRARTSEEYFTLRFTVDFPVPAAAVRLMLTSDGYFGILEPEGDDSTFMATLVSGQDYYITLLINHTSVQRSARGTRIDDNSGDNQAGGLSASDFRVTVSPNPTSGRYTVRVERQDEGLVDIRVRDAHGRTVDQQTASGAQAQYTYNGRLTDDGIYYVTVTCNGRRRTFKLIVVK